MTHKTKFKNSIKSLNDNIDLAKDSADVQFKIKCTAAKNSVKSLVSLFFDETGKHDSEFENKYLTAEEFLSYLK